MLRARTGPRRSHRVRSLRNRFDGFLEGSQAFTLAVNGSNFTGTAVVQWNGSALPTTFVNGGLLQAAVPASAVAEEGPASVTVFDPAAGGTSSAAGFLVVDAPLAASAVPVSPVEGVRFNGPVAMFTDADPGAAPADYQVTIHWGDGQVSPGSLVDDGVVNGLRTLTVVGSHTYSEEASGLSLRVQIQDSGAALSFPNLLAWWAAEGNAVDSAGGNDGTLQHGASFAPGEVGQAFSFDGVNQSVSVGNPAALNPTGGLTLDAWINPQPMTDGEMSALATKWFTSSQVDDYGLFLYKQPGGPIQLLGAIGVPNVSDPGIAGGVIQPGVWSHVAMTYDAATGLNFLYVNGQPVASRTRNGGLFNSAANVYLGREDGPYTRYYAGLLDEVDVYGHALSAAQVQMIYGAGPAGKGSQGTAGTSATVNVADAGLRLAVSSLAASEGVSTGAVTLAAFTDLGGPEPLGDYQATVYWGDGSPQAAALVVANADGSFTVLGSHTYAEEGQYTVRVTVVHDGGITATASATAGVADAPLTATALPVMPASDGSFSGAVATFTDPDPAAAPANYSAWIGWGDGTSSAGMIGVAGSGQFTVSGSHKYGSGGASPHAVSVSVTDVGGSNATPPVVSFAGPLPAHPFSPNGDGHVDTTTLAYSLSEAADVTVAVYDSAGNLVRHLVSAAGRGAGANAESWDGRNDAGVVVPDGTYTFAIDSADAAGNIGARQTAGVVVDTVPPVLSLPPDQTFEATSPTGAVAWYVGATATDALPNPVLSYSLPAGSSFPLGTTVVQVTATDAAGNSAAGTFRIIVRDTPPTASIAGVPAGGTVSVGVPLAMTASATDATAAENAAGFSFSWTVAMNGTAVASGTGPAFTFAPSAAGSYVVSVTATDADGATSAPATTAFTAVAGTGLTAGLSGPQNLVPGQPGTFTLKASGVSGSLQAAGFTYAVNWGDGSPLQVIAATPGNGGGLFVDHVFAQPSGAAGAFTVRVTAIDQAGATASAARAVAVKSVEMQANTLAIGGTTGADVIIVRPVNAQGDLAVTWNWVGQGVYRPSRLLVYGQAGNDVIWLSRGYGHGAWYAVAVPAYLYGGAGTDVLDARGSVADNALFGDAGNDILLGGQGRDLLVGGSGTDLLFAGSADAILIGGTTSYDLAAAGMNDSQKLAALDALMAEWGRRDVGYLTRVRDLLSGVPSTSTGAVALLNARTVHDDGARDYLVGDAGAAMDWFFAAADSSDYLFRFRRGEAVTLVH